MWKLQVFGQAATNRAASDDMPFELGLTLFAGSVDWAEEAGVGDGPEGRTERRWMRCAVLEAGAADGDAASTHVVGNSTSDSYQATVCRD